MLAPDARDEYEQAYGPNGSCWLNVNAWSACRDFCRTTLEALNLVAMATGDSCGTCATNADCAAFGLGAYCLDGLCAGGSSSNADGESGEDGSETDPDTTTDTADGTDTNDDTDGCVPVPPVCQDLLACLDVVLPDVDTSQFEPGGECWCGTTEDADECVDVCTEQLAAAAEAYPTHPACAGPIDPCPKGTEGCECDHSVYWLCEGNLLCNTSSDECEAPVFDECDDDDPLCPAAGCSNGQAYFDKDDDGTPDFAICKFPCEEELGQGECTEISLTVHYIGEEVVCFWGGYFNWNNGLMCIASCDVLTPCEGGSVCVGGECWYDLP